MHHPQQQQQQLQQQQPKPGFLSSTMQKLEQAARSAVPGLTQQFDNLMKNVPGGTTPNPSSSTRISGNVMYAPGPVFMPQHPPPGNYYGQPQPVAYGRGGIMPGQAPGPQPGHYSCSSTVPGMAPPPSHYPPCGPPPAPVTQVYPPPQPVGHAHYSQPGWIHMPAQTAATAAAGAAGWSQLPPQSQHMPGWQAHPAQQQPMQQAMQHPSAGRQAGGTGSSSSSSKEIPIYEAELNLRPSGLPVSSTSTKARSVAGSQATTQAPPAQSAAAGAAAPSDANANSTSSSSSSSDRSLHSTLEQQVLQRLWASAVPAESQGSPAAASALVGRWYHHDAGLLSEVTLQANGHMTWTKTSSSTSSSSSSSASGHVQHYFESVVSAAATPPGEAGQQQQQQQQQEVQAWQGTWQLTKGNTSRGHLQLNFIMVTPKPQQEEQQPWQQAGGAQQAGSGCSSMTAPAKVAGAGASPQPLQCVISYERPVLEDTLLLAGLAHVRLGPA